MNREQYQAKLDQLRESAERRITRFQTKAGELSSDEINVLGQELSIHQVELEMQVDEFIRVQEELTTAKRNFSELLSMLPVAYCVVDKGGVIQTANSMAARLLNNDKLGNGQTKLEHVVSSHDRALYLHFLKQAMAKPHDIHYRRITVSLTDTEQETIFILTYQPEKQIFYAVMLNSDSLNQAD
jgi:PAS domain-containing protein